MKFASIELCAGVVGQALGLKRAGFEHSSLIELDGAACQTLHLNPPHWQITQGDLRGYCAAAWRDIELLAGGVPCPPFSKAGRRLGQADERDLFPEAIRLVSECNPQAVILKNVRGLLDTRFAEYRANIVATLQKLRYVAEWRLLNAGDYGVLQLRPRVLLVALKKSTAQYFDWPLPHAARPLSVGDTLIDLMAANGWLAAEQWRRQANTIAPTLVGGSKKHGGPDLGPTRAKRAWALLGVDGMGIADAAPARDFVGGQIMTALEAAKAKYRATVLIAQAA